MSKAAQHSNAMLEEFGRFIAKADAVVRAEELRQLLIDFFTGNGICMMSYHHLAPAGALEYTQQLTVIAHGFPSDWVRRYESELHLIDPIPRHALKSVHSFYWHEASAFQDLSNDEKYYLEQLKMAQLGDGLAIPVFGPLGRSGYVGLGMGASQRELAPATVAVLQSACQFAHQQYCRILFAQQPIGAPLSPRESEILMWIARGKSNAVIAEILAISSHTVDTHLRRAFSKLDVTDRVTAALRGTALGFL